ncbi:putative anti-sigma regulatory factor, serine/threonine protein kinase [Streptantibioticus cattleyicolor NRRL 8057 = DSM 46488]|uniref:Putative anti-sigma regulatory factor, serine/threonine protein kinase n=2 Tax=Kitasatosporales TaxID=85011 RepID=F8JSL6_STREN
MCFTPTERGARLARRLAARRLEGWGYSPGGAAYDAVVLVVGELAANAVHHGHVPGRDFQLRLAAEDGVVRVEVTDTRGDRMPPERPSVPGPDAEEGRGLWIVAEVAARWGVVPRVGAPGKTVWAEVVV